MLARSELPEKGLIGSVADGGALVGTFFGVFVVYGFFAPMAQSLRSTFNSECKCYLSLKADLHRSRRNHAKSSHHYLIILRGRLTTSRQCMNEAEQDRYYSQ